VDHIWWCTACALPAQAALRTTNATAVAEVRRVSWEGAQRARAGEVPLLGPCFDDPSQAAERDRIVRFIRARADAAEGPLRPQRARRGQVDAHGVAARLRAVASAFERDQLPGALVLGRLRGVAAFAQEPLATVLHTLAKGVEHGAHRDLVRLAAPALMRFAPVEAPVDAPDEEDAEGGVQLRLPLVLHR
jgi:hypothetical protein